MRNKIILAMAAAGMMYGASVFAADTTPTTGPFGSGKINFTGTITNSPCDIAPGDDAITVNLGQISYRHMKAVDDSSDAKQFTIHLQNCAFDANDTTPAPPAGSTGKMSRVQVTFSGPDTTHHSYSSTGSATNVGIQLLKNDGHTIIEPNTESEIQQLQTGNNELNFFARVVATAIPITPGTVEGSVTYTLKYL